MPMKIDIPMDIYESAKELVIIIPLAWVQRESLQMKLEDYKLVLSWERNMPPIKEDLMSVRWDCYRWKFSQMIDLPVGIYLDRIHSKITADNILFIVVPKILTPDNVQIEIE